MSTYKEDARWMVYALELAERGRFTAKPNPCVACVIVKNDQLLAEGWHYKAGLPHAEVNAIKNADVSIKGSTAYVTLEPCHHQGRTGPCTQALIDGGIKRVVIAMLDPNPLVSGKGLEALKHAGIEVVGPLVEFESKARELNLGFLSRMERKRPWVRSKLAVSLDGKTAMANGESQWITGPASRSDVQLWRARSAAIVSGVESILHDDSRLTLREDQLNLPETADIHDVLSLSPLRVVLDTHLRIPENAAILRDDASTLILTCLETHKEQHQKVEALKRKGAHIGIETVGLNESGRLCLKQVLKLLADKECNEVLVESGASLTGAFLQLNLIDELIVYQAPILMGSRAQTMINLPLDAMEQKVQLNIIDRCSFGDDERIIARFDTVA